MEHMRKELKVLQMDQIDLHKRNKELMDKAKDELRDQEKLYKDLADEYHKYPTMISTDELAKRNALRLQIELAKQDQVTYDQELRLIQQDLTGMGRMYERRFQALQKIGFMLRNETFVRRILERKFYKRANFMNLAEMANMAPSGEDAMDDTDVYGTLATGHRVGSRGSAVSSPPKTNAAGISEW